MPKLRFVAPAVKYANTNVVRLPLKIADPQYATPAFRAWRALVVKRADHRCEATDPQGHRCTRAEPKHRMFADHIVEVRDGGALLDPSNGQCFCASHHELKTLAARKRRLQIIVSRETPGGGTKNRTRGAQ
jgi:5-methylcytosine-specific restriction enzyme A